MNHKLIPVIAVAALAGVAGAQMTGLKFSAGYGWTGTITDSGNVGRHMSGPELTATMPLSSLPMVQIGLEGDVLFGGGFGNSSIKGNIYRGLIVANAQVPGSKIGGWYGVGWGTGQGDSGDFASFNGFVTQLGVSFPLGGTGGLGVASPMLQVAGTWGSKSGLSGYSVSVAVKF